MSLFDELKTRGVTRVAVAYLAVAWLATAGCGDPAKPPPKKRKSAIEKKLRPAPAVDIKEEDDSFLIVADIPGVDPKDIEVHMEDGMLTIKGEKEAEAKDAGADYVGCDELVEKIKDGCYKVKPQAQLPPGEYASSRAGTSTDSGPHSTTSSGNMRLCANSATRLLHVI